MRFFPANNFGNIIWVLSKINVKPKTWTLCSNYIVKMHNMIN